MEKVFKVYDYTNYNILKVSVREPIPAENYRYYKKFTKIEKPAEYCGDQRLFYPSKERKSCLISKIFSKIRKFFGLSETSIEKKEEGKKTIYEDILVYSYANINAGDSWIFEGGSTVIYHKNNLISNNFTIEDNIIKLSHIGPGATSILLYPKNGDFEKVNSDIEMDNVWVSLMYPYKVTVHKIKKINDEGIEFDTIYFLHREDVERFIKWVSSFISDTSIIVDDNSGKIIEGGVAV